MRDTDDRLFEYLDEAERDLIESVEREEWKPVKDVDAAKKKARRAAMVTMQTGDRCNVPGPSSGGRNGDTFGGPACISHTVDIDREALDAFVADLREEFGVDTSTQRIALRSLEPPSWLQLVAEAPWWLQALGACAAIYVTELLKGAAKATVRAISKSDSALSALASSVCELRKRHPVRTEVMIGLPVPDERSGALLAIKADSLEGVKHEIALFVYHLPELMELMETEELSRNAVGIIQLVLMDEGHVEVRWTDNDTLERRTKILGFR